MRVAIIPADDTMPIRITTIENTLEAKQKIVDGYIEAIRLEDNEWGSMRMDMYCNEEFLYRTDFTENMRASALWLFSTRVPQVIWGDTVLIGGVGPTGEDLPLSDDQVAYLKKTFILTTDETSDTV
jgi:hypothetical protein